MSQTDPEPRSPEAASWGPTRGWVLLAVGVGTFMSALDGSGVNIDLPVIKRLFASSVAHVEWVVTIYLLVVSALFLGFGRMGDMRGHKPVYMTGFVIFVLGSVLAVAAGVAVLGAVTSAIRHISKRRRHGLLLSSPWGCAPLNREGWLPAACP